MRSPLLEQELAHLHGQIGQVRRKRDGLSGELRLVEVELEKAVAEQQRFDAVLAVCDALDTLAERSAHELFWEGVAEAGQVAKLVERARNRRACFEEELQGLRNQQASLREQINVCLDELAFLEDEVAEAHDRESRRGDEYVIEREISPVPGRAPVMPWSRETEGERSFRKALLVAFLAAFFLGTMVSLLKVPEPIRPVVVVVPERLVSMLRREPPRPELATEEKKSEKEKEKEQGQEQKAPKEGQEQKTPAEGQVQPAAPGGGTAAGVKVEKSGVLAFKESLKGLVDDTPASQLGAQARLSGQAVPGQARPGRSLIALPEGVVTSSRGIGGTAISRTIDETGGKRIAGVEIAKVESAVAEQPEPTKPVISSAEPEPARTDEEIQIVFDKYKAALYRLYNIELRKNPTLRGRIILRITIEPGGEVSACTVQSNDLRSPELLDQIVARVKKFNFGPKEKASRTTILYPIDFLPER